MFSYTWSKLPFESPFGLLNLLLLLADDLDSTVVTILNLILGPPLQLSLNFGPVLPISLQQSDQIEVFLEGPGISVDSRVQVVAVMFLQLLGAPLWFKINDTLKVGADKLPILLVFLDKSEKLFILRFSPGVLAPVLKASVAAVAHLGRSLFN